MFSKLKFLLAFILILCVLMPGIGFAGTGPGLPEIFRVSYDVHEEEINNGSCYVYKEYLKTSSSVLNGIIADAIDLFESEYVEKMPTNLSNPRRNNRLDLHVVHSRTGDRYMSVMVLCRHSEKRVQKYSPFFTVTWDLVADCPVTLSDIFTPDSEAWHILSAGARQQMSEYFPAETASEEKLDSLSSIESLSNAGFTLHAEELTIHFEASELYEGHSGLMHLRFYYSDLRPYMTEKGLSITDNSAYPKVALTFDDGPAYTETATVVNNLRRYGARGTFFVVGNRVSEYADIMQRNFDENNLIGSHTNAHNDASKETKAEIVRTMDRSQVSITNVIGQKATLMRPPYGTAAPYSKAKVNMPIIMWNLDTFDWTGKTSQTVFSTVKKMVKNGDIILMHDIKTNTMTSSEMVCEYLYEQGFMMVTVEELSRCENVDMEPNKVYYRFCDGVTSDDSN